MCIHRITHWQSCHHERNDGVDVCKHAESQGLDPAKCPEGQDTFREGGAGDDCRICADREREKRDRKDKDDREGKEKKDDKHKGSWEAALALGCMGAAHLADKLFRICEVRLGFVGLLV
jgi:hypothetical protein